MLYSNARVRYLAALGLPALPLTIGLIACDGASNPQPEVPPLPTATAEPAGATTSAEPIATATAEPTATAVAQPTATATAAPTATATTQPAVSSWIPVPPPKPGPPGPPGPPKVTEPKASCPEGNFCLASAPARAGHGTAPAPYETCASSTLTPGSSGPSSHIFVRFDAEITKHERKDHPDACCYHWTSLCPGGRALRGSEGAVTAESVVRRDWCAEAPRVAASTTAEEREALAAHWEREAAMEHASVAAFARASLSLLAAGAPADLVARTHAAALDEVAHARLTYALAASYSGTHRGPGPLAVGALPPVATSLADLAAETFIDACAGESVAALALREAAAAAVDPEVAEVLTRIAADEERHAELAWRTVAWALRAGGAGVRQALLASVRRLEDELLAAEGTGAPDAMDLRAHGVLGAAAQREIRRRALADVVLPCARGLLSLADGSPERCTNAQAAS